MNRYIAHSLAFSASALLLLAAGTVRAENEGQDDLDKATEAKLTATDMNDLAEVVRLCESALEKGLDESNAEFAKNLLTSTLLQRAGGYMRIIVERTPRNWPKLREAALEDLTKAEHHDPKSPALHLFVARLQALPGGDSAAALKAAERAAELSKDDPAVHVEAIVLQANLTTDGAKKLELFNAALKVAPNNEVALRNRGLYLLTQGKAAEALVDFEAVAKLDPGDPDAHQARGLTLAMLRRYDDAIDALSETIRLAPQALLPYLYRARIYAHQHKWKEALADLDAAEELDDDNAEIFMLRALVHQQAGNAHLAREALDEALRDRPGLAPALQLRAILSADDGDFQQAIDDLESLLKIAPNNPQLLSQLGMLYTADKRPRKAIETFTEALESNPKHFMSLRGRADAYLNAGKHEEAVNDYESALDLNPTDQGVLNNLAWVLATSPDDEVRDAERAIKLAKKACEVTDYKQAHILSTLGAAYAESGDFDKAIEWSKKAIALGGDDHEAAEQLKQELASYQEKKPWREKQVIADGETNQDKEPHDADKAGDERDETEPGNQQPADSIESSRSGNSADDR